MTNQLDVQKAPAQSSVRPTDGKMAGGEILARMLYEEGVEVVFGIIDGTYFGFYSNLAKYGIRLITPRHETSAAHMAGAYARLTGRLGVCMASNGPGVANVLPGVAVENAEGNNVLLITSARRTGIQYPDRGGTYQCFDHVGVIRPMAKWSESVPSFDRMQELMRTALRQTRRGRPGLVHLDVPENLMNGQTEGRGFWKHGTYGAIEPNTPSDEAVDRAADMLIKASFPIIHAGSGVIHAGAYDELRRVAEALHSPVVTSWAARGVLAETHQLAVSMVYVKLNQLVRRSADVVLTVGSRLGETDWWGKAPYWRLPAEQRMIQVDRDENTLGANKPAELPILGDAREFLGRLADRLEARRSEVDSASRDKVLQKLLRRKEQERAQLDRALSEDISPMHPAFASHVCRKVFRDDAILVADGGNTTIWANFYHEMRTPGTVLSTFKMGMLGAGVAQALGACAAFPDRQVYCIIGDGAMGFHPQEIETAIRNDLRPIYIVLCDRQWGMVKMNQQFALRPLKTLLLKSLGPDETINGDLGEIEFDMLARSMGAHGERVKSAAELEGALKRCLAAKKCAVVHVDVDNVKHMWAPALLTFKEMHQEPKGKY